MQLSKKVFKMDRLATGIVPQGDNRCRFDYKDLEEELKTIVAGKLRDEEASMEDLNDTICPTFVVAIAGLHAEGPPSIFRSYKCHGAPVSKCAIWQAGRATTAAPLLFKPMHIPTPTPGRTFIDGGIAYNNPSELAIKEARRIWPTHQQFCITSIGTGYQRSISFIDSGSSSIGMGGRPLGRMHTWAGSRTADRNDLGVRKVQKILEACADLTTSSDAVHERMHGTAHWYHRFNVERGMESIDLQEWQKFVEMHGHTQNYLTTGEGEQKRNRCVEDLLKVELAKVSYSSQSHIPERETPPNNKPNESVVPEVVPKQSVPADIKTSAGETRSPDYNAISRFVKPVPNKEESKEDTDGESDDDTDNPSVLYPGIKDWISELSPRTYKSFDYPASQDDILLDPSSENRAFRPYSPLIEEEGEEDGKDEENEEEEVDINSVIPKVTVVEKPLSLVAYEFAEAVDHNYYQNGDTEFIPSGLNVLQQLLGSQRANMETHYLYARLLWAGGRHDDSCEQYETVMELNPENERRTPAMYVQNYICDDCRRGGGEDGGISGHRYKCTSCRDYDLCNECFPPTSTSHPPGHRFLQIPSNRWLRENGLVCLSLTSTDC
jgi:hypothetical protein